MRWSDVPAARCRARALRVYLAPVAAPVDRGPLPAVMEARSAVRRSDRGVRSRTRLVLAPDLAGRLDDQPQLGELVVPGELVALLRRGEPALRRQAQLV